MQQIGKNKILIPIIIFSYSLFSNEKDPIPKTSCEKEDCKIQVKSKEKNKLINFHKENITAIQNNLNKIKNQSFKNQETEKKWIERIEKNLYEEENLQTKEQESLKEVYNKELKFSATGNRTPVARMKTLCPNH